MSYPEFYKQQQLRNRHVRFPHIYFFINTYIQHENYKINIFGAKQCGDIRGEGQANFSGNGGIPPVPPQLGETLSMLINIRQT